MYPSRNKYEPAPEYRGAYQTVRGPDVAWRVLGWETEPDEDTEWSGIENRTDRLIVRMVGDDRHFAAEPDEIVPLPDEAYCSECGQIGCDHGLQDELLEG